MTHFQKLTDSEYEDSFIESISGALNVRITSSLQEEQDSLSNFQIHCDTPKRQSFQRLLKDDGEEIQESLTGDEKSDLFADYSPALENVRYLAGEWGTHRFEKEPWHKAKSLSAMMINRKSIPRRDSTIEEQGNEEEEDDEDYESVDLGILTDDVIKSTLSNLVRSPIDLKYVYCKCVLSNKGLHDISAIKYYHYIQYLDVSKNDLTTLAALEQLPFLQYLDASYNNLETVLDFKAPFFLSKVNLSYNMIRVIRDLTEFWSITDLNLSNNNIEKISGLDNLRFLSFLNLSHNKIEALDNLNNLRIQVLILHHNQIDNNIVEDDPVQFRTLDCVRIVDLSYNRINSLEMFRGAYSVEDVDMSSNNISSLLELYNLSNIRYLFRLNLKNNPVTSMKYYFSVCVDVVKNLITLDGRNIPAEKRIMVQTNTNPLHTGKISHTDLVLLQQINYPNIGTHILPVNHPRPIIIVLVGAPGSRKGFTVKKFCRTNKMLLPGVSYTTRPKMEDEVDGQDYYFITCEEFRNLARNGDFIAVSEFNGHSFGITTKEVYKDVDKILVFHSNLVSAVSMKARGINPKLILAMPRSESVHLKWLKEKYFYNEINQEIVRWHSNANFSQYPLKDIHARLIKEKLKLIDDVESKIFDMKDHGKHDTTMSLSTFTTQFFFIDCIEIRNALRWDVSTEKESSRDSKRVSFNESQRYGQQSMKTDTEQRSHLIIEDNETEKLNLFFKKIIQVRNELLEAHWSRPGLFYNIIFTDETRQSMKKLKNLLKNTFQAYNIADSSLSTADDDTYERTVKIRLSNLDFQGFTKLTNNVPPHCDCDVQYIEKHF